MVDDPYAVLGVDPGASEAELRRAFVDLARRHHPDRGGDPEAMRRVNAAWEQVRHGAGPAEPPPADDEPDVDDVVWLDPRPLSPPRRSPADLVPVLLFIASVATGCVALALDAPRMLGFAAFLFFLSCMAVGAAAMLAMRRR